MEIIILIIIISLLAVILFLALKKLIESITADSKEYYFKKVQDLDNEISKKKTELDSLNPNENLDTKEEEKIRVENKNIDKNLLDVFNSSDYSGENALKIANQVDEIFQIDEEKILKEFIKNTVLDEDYENLQKLQDRFSPNLIYKLKMLDKDTQIKTIFSLIDEKEYEIFDSYVKTKNFKLNKFLQDLDMIIEKTKPTIEVMVGNKKKDYSTLSPYIKMTYTDDIYKGIIIKYKGQIYDYSINERDV